MSSNIIINSEIEDCPNEILGHINSFLDRESRRNLSNVNQRFRIVVVDSVCIEAKSELRIFKKFIIETVETSYEIYKKNVAQLKLFQTSKEELVLQYEKEINEINNTFDNLFIDEADIKSLEELEIKERDLFCFFKASKIVFFISRYFPNIKQEMNVNTSQWLSSYGMFCHMMDTYAHLNTFIADAQPELDEIKNLITQGYTGPGFAGLACLNRETTNNILICMFEALQNKTVSRDVFQKIIELTPLIEDNIRLVLSHRNVSIHELLQEERIKILKMLQDSPWGLNTSEILTKLCAATLSLEEKNMVFEIIEAMDYDNQKMDVLFSFCNCNLLQEERMRVLKIIQAVETTTSWVLTWVLKEFCVSRSPSLEERSEILKIIRSKNIDKVDICKILCSCDLLPGEIEEMLEIVQAVAYHDREKKLVLAMLMNKKQ